MLCLFLIPAYGFAVPTFPSFSAPFKEPGRFSLQSDHSIQIRFGEEVLDVLNLQVVRDKKDAYVMLHIFDNDSEAEGEKKRPRPIIILNEIEEIEFLEAFDLGFLSQGEQTERFVVFGTPHTDLLHALALKRNGDKWALVERRLIENTLRKAEKPKIDAYAAVRTNEGPGDGIALVYRQNDGLKSFFSLTTFSISENKGGPQMRMKNNGLLQWGSAEIRDVPLFAATTKVLWSKMAPDWQRLHLEWVDAKSGLTRQAPLLFPDDTLMTKTVSPERKHIGGGETTWEVGAEDVQKYLSEIVPLGRPVSFDFSEVNTALADWYTRGRFEFRTANEYLRYGKKPNLSPLEEAAARTLPMHDLIFFLLPVEMTYANPYASSDLAKALVAREEYAQAKEHTRSEVIYLRIEDTKTLSLPDPDMLFRSKLGEKIFQRKSEDQKESLPPLFLVIELLPHPSGQRLYDDKIQELVKHLGLWRMKFAHLGLAGQLRVAVIADNKTVAFDSITVGTTSSSSDSKKSASLESGVAAQSGAATHVVNPWGLLSTESRRAYLANAINNSLDTKLTPKEVSEILFRTEKIVPRKSRSIDTDYGIENELVEASRIAWKNSEGNEETFLNETARILSSSRGGFVEPRFEIEDLRKIELIDQVLDIKSPIPYPVKAIGRSRQLRAIKQKMLSASRGGFKDKPVNVIVLFGESGTGKTELAEAIARVVDAEYRYVDARKSESAVEAMLSMTMPEISRSKLLSVAMALQASKKNQKIAVLDEFNKSDSDTLYDEVSAILGNRDSMSTPANFKGTTLFLLINVEKRDRAYQDMLRAYVEGRPTEPYVAAVLRSALVREPNANERGKQYLDAEGLALRFSNDAVFFPPISVDRDQQEQLIDLKIRQYEKEKGVRLILPADTQAFMTQKALENTEGNFRTVERALPVFIRAAEASYALRNPDDDKLRAARFYVLNVEKEKQDSNLTLTPLRLGSRSAVSTLVRDQSLRFYEQLLKHFSDQESSFQKAKSLARDKDDIQSFEAIAGAYRGLSAELRRLREELSRELVGAHVSARGTSDDTVLGDAVNSSRKFKFDSGDGNLIFKPFPALIPEALGLVADSSNAAEFSEKLDKSLITFSKLLLYYRESSNGGEGTLLDWFEHFVSVEKLVADLPYPEQVGRAYGRLFASLVLRESKKIIDELVAKGAAAEIEGGEKSFSSALPLPPELMHCRDLIKARRAHAEEIEEILRKRKD